MTRDIRRRTDRTNETADQAAADSDQLDTKLPANADSIQPRDDEVHVVFNGRRADLPLLIFSLIDHYNDSAEAAEAPDQEHRGRFWDAYDAVTEHNPWISAGRLDALETEALADQTEADEATALTEYRAAQQAGTVTGVPQDEARRQLAVAAMLLKHHGPWTVEDLEPVGEAEFNTWEIDNGVLVVSPRSRGTRHQTASRILTNSLANAIEAALLELEAVQAVDVTTTHRNDWLKVPDIVVVTAEAFDKHPPSYDAADVILVVEISDARQSHRRDFGEKLDAYAEIGIENYWILDLEADPKLTIFQLADGAYSLIDASHSPMRLHHPIPIDIDPASLEPLSAQLSNLPTPD